MLTTPTDHEDLLSEFPTIDSMEQELGRLEGLVSRVRARQLDILAAIDRLQVPYWDGTRSLKEWIAGRLDITPRNAADLAVLAETEPGPIRHSLSAGAVTVDRAAATARLANTGATQEVLDQADGLPINQIARLAARHQRMTPLDEATAHGMRRLWFQPNLANTLATGTFTMTGTDMETLLDAIDTRADQIINPNDEHRPRLEQRRIDALISLALDTTTPIATTADGATAPAPRRLKAHIFIDAPQAAATNGQTGALTRSGLKVGPNTLAEILCIGETQTTLIDTNALKTIPTNGDRIPNRLRDDIFHRDGACTADGCTSRYRLEPHHIDHQTNGRDHDPNNLTLLCWFHHHVIIHQNGFRIDPESPPHKRRFLPPGITRAPPDG